MNKKGFTLVELLAVIVILAVVMLIGGTTVLPMMQKAQKSSLGTEGVSLKKAAENAFNSELIKGANSGFKFTDRVCFSIAYLCNKGYYDKGCSGISRKDKYGGSVLVEPGDGQVKYTMWITNGTYSFMGDMDATYGGYRGYSEDEITNPDNAGVPKSTDDEQQKVQECGIGYTNIPGTTQRYVKGIDVFCSNTSDCVRNPEL